MLPGRILFIYLYFFLGGGGENDMLLERKFRAENGGLKNGTYPICTYIYGSAPPTRPPPPPPPPSPPRAYMSVL